jgi:subtilisin-like proprotein convertase family protein
MKSGFGDSSVVVDIVDGAMIEDIDFTLTPVIEYMSCPGVAIPDNNPAGIRVYIDVDADANLASVDCYIGVTHTYIGDLTVELTSPMGTTVRLHNRTGTATDNINTWYDSETAPDGPGTMADFAGEWPVGQWELFVSDGSGRDTGTLDCWGLRLAFPSSSAGIEPLDTDIPKEHFLFGARPNPFAGSTHLRFGLAWAEEVRMVVYNVAGQEVAVIADGLYEAGVHSLSWDGTGAGGRPVASGIYFCRLKAGEFMATKQMVFMR